MPHRRRGRGRGRGGGGRGADDRFKKRDPEGIIQGYVTRAGSGGEKTINLLIKKRVFISFDGLIRKM